ncbi:hypothetical protein [Salibacterium sp. K-3]
MERQKQCPECGKYKINEKMAKQIWFYILIPAAIYFMVGAGSITLGVLLFAIPFFILGRWYYLHQFRSLRLHSAIYGMFWGGLFLIAPASTFTGESGQGIFNFMAAAVAINVICFIISFVKISRSESGGQKEVYRCESCGYEWEEHPPKEKYA